jgi:uncharacterized protein YpmB
MKSFIYLAVILSAALAVPMQATDYLTEVEAATGVIASAKGKARALGEDIDDGKETYVCCHGVNMKQCGLCRRSVGGGK